MSEVTVKLKNLSGLHARPAAALVQTATHFAADVRLRCGTKEGNGKSILSILGLGITCGAELTIQTEGEDAEAALQALAAFVEAGLGEGIGTPT